MPPQRNRKLTILVVGGNAVSAFLSWRLQATNACDVTLVWKQDHEYVSQYGINWTTNNGKEKNRFKPHATVKAPEEAQHNAKNPFDYVLLCVKALPDVYDLASVIESVVAPAHTCILLNTTSSLGVEQYIEERFSSNVLLSLVCGADLVQTGATDFEHRGDSSDISVGWANPNPSIPASIQRDMAEALAMTLSTSGVTCSVSENIRQQQFDKMIGPIAFHTTSVLFDCPNHTELLEKTGARSLINGVIEELITLAKGLGCKFDDGFAEATTAAMIKPNEKPSVMYADYQGKRPMEVETYLGSPIRMSKSINVHLPRVETLYAMLSHKNKVNLATPAPALTPAAEPMPRGPTSPTLQQLPPRSSSVAGHNGRPTMNGSMPNGGQRRAPSMNGPMGPGPGMRRGPVPNGYGPRMANGHGPPFPQNGMQNGMPNGMRPRRQSMGEDDLQEFSHLMLYEGPEANFQEGYGDPNTGDLAIRERELALRQREIELKERQMNMRQRRPPPPPSQIGAYDDDDEDDDFFDPMNDRKAGPEVDDNFDMMSVTSRRNRKAPHSSSNGYRGPPQNSRNPFSRGPPKRGSARVMQDIPDLRSALMNDALLGTSSNRYGAVDRATMGQESRTGSLTQARLDELQRGGGGPPGPGPYGMQRRASQSPGPGQALDRGPMPPGKRPSPPNGMHPHANGMNGGMNLGPPGRNFSGRPSPPNGMNGMMRQPMPRYPQGLGPAHSVEQFAGVSTFPSKQKPPMQVRSLTGSASASAESGESGASAHAPDSDPSANSSQSSLQVGARMPMGIRG